MLDALELRTEYRKHHLVPRSGGAGAMEVLGYLLFRPIGTAEQLFLTDVPMEKPIVDMISSGQWEIK